MNLSAQMQQHIDECKSVGPCRPCDGHWMNVGQTRYCAPNVGQTRDCAPNLHPSWKKSSMKKVFKWEHDAMCKCAGWWLEGQLGGSKNFWQHFDDLSEAVARHPLAVERFRAMNSAVPQFCPMWRSYVIEAAAAYDAAFPTTSKKFSLLQVDSDGAHSTAFLAGGASGKTIAIAFTVPVAAVLVICMAAWHSRRAKAGRLLLGDGTGEQSCEEVPGLLPHEPRCHSHVQA